MSTEFASAKLTGGQLNAIVKKLGGHDGALKFLRGELVISEANPSRTPKPSSVVDSIIRVDHSIRPSYPKWVKKVLYPELEKSGPAGYDITKVDHWLHEDQKGGKHIEGNEIYAYLRYTGDLKNHLGLRDLEEIKKKGIAFFRNYFVGKCFGWASVVQNLNGNLYVPCLYEDGGRVILYWYWLGHNWNDSNPALCHAS